MEAFDEAAKKRAREAAVARKQIRQRIAGKRLRMREALVRFPEPGSRARFAIGPDDAGGDPEFVSCVVLDRPVIDVWVDVDLSDDEAVLRNTGVGPLALCNVYVMPDDEAEPLKVWAGRCEGFDGDHLA